MAGADGHILDRTTTTTQPTGGGGSRKEQQQDRPWRSFLPSRKKQITLYDPETRSLCYCRDDSIYCCDSGSLLDFEEDSTDRIAQPLDTIPDSERDQLELALGVLYVKVSASQVGFPVSVYGTIVMRDDFDHKCMYLFKRDRDNCQVINSPGEMLMLTGPNRGPFDSIDYFFEINLKIRQGDEEETMDRIFSRTLEHQEYPLDQWTKKIPVSSWLSRLELAYRSVHYAVEATVGIRIVRGPPVFYGRLIACSSEESTEVVLIRQ